MASERIGMNTPGGFTAEALRGSRPLQSDPPERRNAAAPATQQPETTVSISQRAQELAALDQQTATQQAQSSQADEQASSEQASDRGAQLRRSYNLET